MSVSQLLSQRCASVGGTYRDGACRCSDGSLKNMNTGECVSEPSAPLVTPVIAPPRVSYTPDEVEAADPNGSPRLRGSRDRYVTSRDVKWGELDVSGGIFNTLSRGLADITEQGREIVEARRRGSVLPFRVTDGAGTPGGGTGAAPRVDLELRYDSSTPPATTTPEPGATVEPVQAGLPPALILGLLSFLIFRS